ncbi:MAG: hypothetical protein HY203_07605 [Nitrospirae bacterium]|nr:hypothetical protein [Nitrospirota bacterium]
MASGKKTPNKKTGHGDKMGFEEKLWQAGDVVMQDLISQNANSKMEEI